MTRACTKIVGVGDEPLRPAQVASDHFSQRSPDRIKSLDCGYSTSEYTDSRLMGTAIEEMYFLMGSNSSQIMVWCASLVVEVGLTGCRVGKVQGMEGRLGKQMGRQGK